MAAIDRINFKSYEDFDQLRKWAIVYYPKLLLWFYDLFDNNFSRETMSLPFSIDRKLKWICPVPCVREYLHKQCGVNPKWEWLYRLFWKGKKHF